MVLFPANGLRGTVVFTQRLLREFLVDYHTRKEVEYGD